MPLIKVVELRRLLLDAASRRVGVVDLGVDAAELGALAVCEGVEGIEANVEARSSVVDGEDVDLLALVLEAVAATTVGRVPALNDVDTTDILGRGAALSCPAVSGDETVLAIGARDGGHRARLVIVASVVRDGGGRDGGGKSESREDAGELHVDGWLVGWFCVSEKKRW
ncbi:hypothetical protein HG530_007494 [Fusarium avenaceum]|nr:hypothetical protein HG530_007494 [Fusarium avenaceum]